jgi:hypothetical protein
MIMRPSAIKLFIRHRNDSSIFMKAYTGNFIQKIQHVRHALQEYKKTGFYLKAAFYRNLVSITAYMLYSLTVNIKLKKTDAALTITSV